MIDIQTILKKHMDWLNGEDGGVKANLSKANLSKANLCGANLSGADLAQANLSGANLREADLSEADLREADLREADLREADLSEANLREADLCGAIISFSTTIYGKYELCYRASDEQIRFISGCQNFSIQEARDHWGSKKYPDKARGRRMLDCCEMLYRWWDDGALLGVTREKAT